MRHVLIPKPQPLHPVGGEPRWFCRVCWRHFTDWPADEECTGRPTEDAA